MIKDKASIELASLINKYQNMLKNCEMAVHEQNIQIGMCCQIISSLEETKDNINHD